MSQSNLGALAEVAAATRFWPRLQLFGASSEAVKRRLIAVGSWALVKGQDIAHNYGDTCEVFVLAGRPKALDTSGDSAIVSYDPSDAIFQGVKLRSSAPNSRAMFGPEYLLWVPQFTYITYFMCNESARQEAHSVTDAIGKFVIFGSRLAVGSKNRSWLAPTVTQTEGSFDVPELLLLQEAIQSFLNPPKDERELAPEAGEERAR